MEKQVERIIKILRNYMGRAYVKFQFIKFLTDLTESYTLQQKGFAKRANRTIVEISRNIILHSGYFLYIQWSNRGFKKQDFLRDTV